MLNLPSRMLLSYCASNLTGTLLFPLSSNSFRRPNNQLKALSLKFSNICKHETRSKNVFIDSDELRLFIRMHNYEFIIKQKVSEVWLAGLLLVLFDEKTLFDKKKKKNHDAKSDKYF